MIYIIAACHSYRRSKIFGIAMIRGEDNPPECLSKVICNGKLEHLMKIGVDGTPAQQWNQRQVIEGVYVRLHQSFFILRNTLVKRVRYVRTRVARP